MRYGYDMAVDARTVVNALAYAAYVAVARMAAALGFHADAEQCTAWADSLRLAINARLVNVDDLYVDGLHIDGTLSTHASQHANALPLALDLVPNERRAAVVDHVKGLKVSMGMVTVGWLIRALGEADEGEHLLDVYTRSDWDGWARCLARGATCTWESWDADARGGLSLSHPWGAVGLVGLQQYVLGVRALAPQYEHVQIKPLAFGEQLTWAEGRVPTDRGDLHVRWEYQAGRVALRMTLPANVRARVCVARGAVPELSLTVDGQPVAAEPEGRYLVVDGIGSGSHIIERGP
jgi:alpha-L-rhamnosidase